jgi:hypothetical protein
MRIPAWLMLAVLVVAGVTGPAVSRPAGAQPPPTRELQAEASREGWQETGIVLHQGDTVTITAAGRAGWEPGQESGPEGTPIGAGCTPAVPWAPIGALVARVGVGAPVVVAGSVTLAGPGAVDVLYNDCPGLYYDNSGAYTVRLRITPAPAPATPAPTAAPAPAPVRADGGSPLGKVLPALAGIALVAGGAGAGIWYVRRYRGAGGAPRFNPSARLESSAWLAPMRLRLLQDERRGRRYLTVGGPDADIDFGLPGVWARLYATEDGGVRLEPGQHSGKLLLDGVPVVVGQRLVDGARVFMGTREFVFRVEPEPPSARRPDHARRRDPLAKPDPRAA